MSLIKLQDVTKTYYMGSNEYQALKGINLTIDQGEMMAIIGPSGSGKTSTMNIIGLLDKPTTGEYLLHDKPTSDLSSDELAKLRNRTIGFVFQSFFLLPRLTALQNVGMPLMYRKVSKKIIKQKSLDMLGHMGIRDLAYHRPYELSGGQQQRVAIARALVGEPSLILADEPTGALDSKTSDAVMELLLHQSKSTTVIIITHDPEVAKQCTRVTEIYDGVIR